ncbi:MFS transporter [Acidianus sp. RZ1]|uniref:MFS transporter n=1 Tax=Acidianus sp. RZ1 TaxID=1540082 RepID=UPI00210F50CD|nr:MFS transporter [Acidianus sp. RZ1]
MSLSPSFYKFWMSRNLIRLSVMMFYIYFMWTIVEKFNSIFLVSLIPTLSLLGYFLVALPEGYLLDKVNRTYVIFGSSIINFAIYAVLLINSSLIAVYLVDLLASVFSLISADAFHTYVKDAVESNELGKAISYSVIGRSSSEIGGSLIGGLSAAYFQSFFPWIILIISAISVIISLPEKVKRKIDLRPSVKYRTVLSVIRPIAFFIVLIMIINGLFISIDVLASGFFHLVLHSTALFYTLFILGFSVGSLVGGIIGERIANKLFGAKFTFLAFVSLSIGFFAIVLIDKAIFEPVITFLMGLEVSIADIPLMAFFTRIIPTRVLGRVNSILNIFINGSSPVMASVFGGLSNLLSVSDIFIVVGTLTFLVSIPAYFSIKRIFKMREEDMEKILQKEQTKEKG